MRKSPKSRHRRRPAPEVGYSRNFLRARFEAALILAAWALCLVWTVGYSGLAAYDSPDEAAVIFGIPGWVFWGVVAPWVAALLFSVWFSLFFMVDEEPVASDTETDEEEKSRTR